MSAQTRRCISCHEVRPRDDYASSQARRCDHCKAAGGPPRPCSRCKEVRTADQFVHRGHVCESCRAEVKPPRACLRCHEVKPASAFPVGTRSKEGKRRERQRQRKSTRLSGVCHACWDAEEQAKRERRAWEQDGRMVKRCTKCSQVRDFPEDFYGSKRSADGVVRYEAQCKPCVRARAEANRRAKAEDPERRKAHLARRAALERKRRAKNRERIREINRLYRLRVKADPDRHAARLETARMNYRLRQERNGRHLDEIKTRDHRDASVGGYLPAPPLVAALERWLRRQTDPIDVALEGIGIVGRTMRAWKPGPDGRKPERATVHMAVADTALTGMGLHWWDVWTGEDYEKAERLWEGPARGRRDQSSQDGPVPDLIGEYRAQRQARRDAKRVA